MTAATQAIGSKYLPDCSLYVTLEPCVMCAGALAWAQLGALYYGASDAKRGYAALAANCLHPKTIVQGGLMAKEASQLMKTFFSSKR